MNSVMVSMVIVIVIIFFLPKDQVLLDMTLLTYITWKIPENERLN